MPRENLGDEPLQPCSETEVDQPHPLSKSLPVHKMLHNRSWEVLRALPDVYNWAAPLSATLRPRFEAEQPAPTDKTPHRSLGTRTAGKGFVTNRYTQL